MPKTYLGKWSVGLAGVFIALFMLAQIVAAVGRSQGAFEPERSSFYAFLFPAIIIPVGICGIGAFFTGIISIIKRKERSVLVIITTIIGFIVLDFVLGEFLFPQLIYISNLI